MPKIEILSGKREGDVVELPPDGIDIGNRKTAKLSLRDPWISWNHAKIVQEEGRFVIEDLGSSNGTWINGKKVTRQPLSADEVIFLGKTKVRFVEASTETAVEGLDPEPSAGTMKLSRSAVGAPAGPGDDRLSALERENAELRKMKEALERFLDLTPEERLALGGAAGAGSPEAAGPSSASDDGAAEKARREAAAEARAPDLEGGLKERSEQSKKELQRARERFEEELGFARAAKTEAEALRDKAEEKARDLAKKVESAASDANARADKLERDLETARKSALEAEASAQKLERDLAQAVAGRDDWKRRHDQVREEIDKISMDQIEIEDQLRARIAELEGKGESQSPGQA